MENKQTVEFDVYEMEYKGDMVRPSISKPDTLGSEASEANISPIPFEENYYEQYSNLINTCFYEMRKVLNIQPYDRYCADLEELMEQKEDIFLLWGGDVLASSDLIGAVSCHENEIENLAVNLNYQRQGYGRKLMKFALDTLQKRGASPIKLTVTTWNKNAIALYESLGFAITKETTVKGMSAKDTKGTWTFEFTTTGGLNLQ